MKRFKVLVAASSGSHLSRLFAGGVAKYTSSRDDWDTRFIMGREDDMPADELARERFDGAIVAFLHPPEPLVAAGIPIFRLWAFPALVPDVHGRHPPLPRSPFHEIISDEIPTGRLVASYFLERGFRNFAFAGGLQFGPWSDAREASFVEALRKCGYACHVYPYGGRNAPRLFSHSKREDARTAKWLKSLPKPVAIFTAYDRRGEQILRCCRNLGLAVPKTVAVVGMDNDETICWSCVPPLSSVEQNLPETGQLAARDLDRLMRGWRPPGGTLEIHTSASGIVTRASSDVRLNPVSVLVDRARNLMADKADPPASVGELARRLRVSERLLRLRFRQSTGKSPHEAMAAARLDRAMRMITETKAPLAEIAAECGFADASHMSKAFSAAFGKSPAAFRGGDRG